MLPRLIWESWWDIEGLVVQLVKWPVFGSRQGYRFVLSLLGPERLWGPSRVQWIPEVLPPTRKLLELKTDTSSSSKNAWNYTPSLIYTFMAWCLYTGEVLLESNLKLVRPRLTSGSGALNKDRNENNKERRRRSKRLFLDSKAVFQEPKAWIRL